MRRLLALVVGVTLVAIGLGLAAPSVARAADPYPGTDRNPEVFRIHDHVTGDRSHYAADADRQPGEKVLRVYIAGGLAKRHGGLWFRKIVNPPPGKMIHVRIVTTTENFHRWVRVGRIDI